MARRTLIAGRKMHTANATCSVAQRQHCGDGMWQGLYEDCDTSGQDTVTCNATCTTSQCGDLCEHLWLERPAMMETSIIPMPASAVSRRPAAMDLCKQGWKIATTVTPLLRRALIVKRAAPSAQAPVRMAQVSRLFVAMVSWMQAMVKSVTTGRLTTMITGLMVPLPAMPRVRAMPRIVVITPCHRFQCDDADSVTY